MKISLRDKKFRILMVAILVTAVLAAGLYFIISRGKNSKLVEYNGVSFTMGSTEAKFMEEYYSDESDKTWRSQKDISKVDREINRVLRAFRKSLEKGDWDNAKKYISEDSRDTYTDLLAEEPGKMKLLSEYIENIEMIHLAEEPDDSSTYFRTAEYNRNDDESGTPVIFINIDGEWYIDNL